MDNKNNDPKKVIYDIEGNILEPFDPLTTPKKWEAENEFPTIVKSTQVPYIYFASLEQYLALKCNFATGW
jgi:hypothetical protein